MNENVKNNFINSTVTNYLNLKLSLRDLNLLGDIIPINQSQLRSLSGNDEDIKVDVILTGKMQLSSEYKKNLFTNERKVSKFKAEVDNENINFLLSHLHKRIVVDCIRTKKYLNKIDVFNKLKDELNREN